MLGGGRRGRYTGNPGTPHVQRRQTAARAADVSGSSATRKNTESEPGAPIPERAIQADQASVRRWTIPNPSKTPMPGALSSHRRTAASPPKRARCLNSAPLARTRRRAHEKRRGRGLDGALLRRAPYGAGAETSAAGQVIAAAPRRTESGPSQLSWGRIVLSAVCSKCKLCAEVCKGVDHPHVGGNTHRLERVALGRKCARQSAGDMRIVGRESRVPCIG